MAVNLCVSCNTMDTSQDDDIKYYDNRVEEFDRLLSEAKSQTLIDLLKKAKGDSEKAIQKLIEIQRATVAYLKTYELKNDEVLQKFQKQIDLQIVEVKKLKEADIDRTLKGSILQIHEEVANKINDSLTQREELRKLTFKVFISCATDFRITLLEKIFKPANAKFHYETIIDILNYIIGKIIPLLDEAKTVANFSATKRRKQFANQGDKIFIYLEQYIDVLEKWTTLGNALIKLTED